MSSNKSVLGLCIAVFAFVVVPALPADAGFSKTELKCRSTIAKGGGKLAATVSKTLGKCHKSQAKGKVAASVDCNSIAGADDKGKVAKAEGKLRSSVGGAKDKCYDKKAGVALVSADLGYNGCPSPCGDIVINGFADVGDCIVCLADSSAQAMSEAAQGSPGSMGKTDAKCHGGIGKNQGKYFATILKERVKCQSGAEKKEGVTTTDFCLTANPKGKITGTYAKSVAGIAKSCGTVPDLSAVDSCSSTNVTTLTNCLLDDANTRGDALFLAFFGLEADAGTGGGGGGVDWSLQDLQCPSSGEIIIRAGAGGLCSSTADCPLGTCDLSLGRCRTVSRLASGQSGIAHGADVTENVSARGFIQCEGPANPTCGTCQVVGADPSGGSCRCANDNRTICDEPFAADADDCGGDICNCYFGPPLSLSAGNTPACVVNKVTEQPSGVVNVDLGQSDISVQLRAQVFLGESLVMPCPYCDGDVTINDGVRDGTCVGGRDAGASCDGGGINTSFPAPGGAAHSLDCFPMVGKNVSGQGLMIDLSSTTGTASLSFNLPCGFPYFGKNCPCRVCSGDSTLPCNSDAECTEASAGSCNSIGSGTNVGPNGCDGNVCVEEAGSNGERGVCATGPAGDFCDGVVKANGEGFLACAADVECEVSTIGVDAGACTLTQMRSCYLDPIQVTGVANPGAPVIVAAFCIPPTGNAGINGVAGLPGAGQIKNTGNSRSFCAFDPSVEYQPGVGGCPAPTWTDVQAILTSNCAGCHAGGVSQGSLGGLDDYNAGYDALVNTPAQCDAGLMLVVPGDADSSFLLNKVEGEPPACGASMPVGADELSAFDRKVIRAWINDGAPKN